MAQQILLIEGAVTVTVQFFPKLMYKMHKKCKVAVKPDLVKKFFIRHYSSSLPLKQFSVLANVM